MIAAAHATAQNDPTTDSQGLRLRLALNASAPTRAALSGREVRTNSIREFA